MRAYMYVVAASTRADDVTCNVPLRLDGARIFFGPCKKALRAALRAEAGLYARHHGSLAEPLLVVGLSSTAAGPVRTVLWAGLVTSVMTFAHASRTLTPDVDAAMLERPVDASPLHVRPIEIEGGRLVGYRHAITKQSGRTRMHDEDWHLDLVGRDRRRAHVDADRLVLQDVNAAVTGGSPFSRDACMLLSNIFFAQGRGLPLDAELVSVLQDAQPARGDSVDAWAPFGRIAGGGVNGKRGTGLVLHGAHAERLLRWIQARAQQIS